jgi:hypothetical protein
MLTVGTGLTFQMAGVPKILYSIDVYNLVGEKVISFNGYQETITTWLSPRLILYFCALNIN